MILVKTLRNYLHPTINRYLVNATLTEGTLKGTDKLFRCLFMENSNMMEYMCSHSYESYPRILKEWKVWIPNLQRTIRENLSSIDLCIAVLPKKNEAELSRFSDFTGDEWVRQIMNTSGTWEEIKSRFHKTKRQVSNQIRHKYAMSYRVSNDLKDFELFYYHMHVPHIKNQFGNQAYLEEFEVMRDYFQKGFLLLITAENQDVAGALCLKYDDVLIFRRTGVLIGSELYIKRVVQYAMYYFLIHYAWENGFKTLDTMKSRSCLNDGVFKTKRDWGTTVYNDDESENTVFYFVPRYSETISTLFENYPAIIHGEKGLHGLIGWKGTDNITMSHKKEISTKYYSPGLKGIILLSPNGKKTTVVLD